MNFNYTNCNYISKAWVYCILYLSLPSHPLSFSIHAVCVCQKLFLHTRRLSPFTMKIDNFKADENPKILRLVVNFTEKIYAKRIHACLSSTRTKQTYLPHFVVSMYVLVDHLESAVFVSEFLSISISSVHNARTKTFATIR